MAPAHHNMKEEGRVINKWLPWGQGANDAYWRTWYPSIWGTIARMAENHKSCTSGSQGVTEITDTDAKWASLLPHPNPQFLELGNLFSTGDVFGCSLSRCQQQQTLKSGRPTSNFNTITFCVLPSLSFFSIGKWGYYYVPPRGYCEDETKMYAGTKRRHKLSKEKPLLLSTLRKCI